MRTADKIFATILYRATLLTDIRHHYHRGFYDSLNNNHYFKDDDSKMSDNE